MTWLAENWDLIFEVIGIAGTTCTAIVKAFSGCKWASVIVKICDWLSFVNTEENKEKIAKATKKK